MHTNLKSGAVKPYLAILPFERRPTQWFGGRAGVDQGQTLSGLLKHQRECRGAEQIAWLGLALSSLAVLALSLFG